MGANRRWFGSHRFGVGVGVGPACHAARIAASDAGSAYSAFVPPVDVNDGTLASGGVGEGLDWSRR